MLLDKLDAVKLFWVKSNLLFMTPSGLVWYLGNRQPIDPLKATVLEARSSSFSNMYA